VWAGVVPLQVHAAEPIPDARMLPGVPALDLRRFARR
jgi:hypothetical protein